MRNTIITIIVLIILVFIGYTYMGKKPEPDAALVSNKDTNIKVGSELLANLGTIDSLKIDTEFFKNQTFRRLINFSRDIPSQPKGRSNPFAPIGSGSASSTNSQ